MLLTRPPAPPLEAYVETAAIRSVMGVVFRPGAARGFFEAPASDLYDRVVPLDAFWGHALRQFRHVPHVRTVMAVAAEAGLSRRRFSQLFHEQVGGPVAARPFPFLQDAPRRRVLRWIAEEGGQVV